MPEGKEQVEAVEALAKKRGYLLRERPRGEGRWGPWGLATAPPSSEKKGGGS